MRANTVAWTMLRRHTTRLTRRTPESARSPQCPALHTRVKGYNTTTSLQLIAWWRLLRTRQQRHRWLEGSSVVFQFQLSEERKDSVRLITQDLVLCTIADTHKKIAILLRIDEIESGRIIYCPVCLLKRSIESCYFLHSGEKASAQGSSLGKNARWLLKIPCHNDLKATTSRGKVIVRRPRCRR